MKEETYNEMEIQKLEEEIRAMGVPYSENEPDDRYFANFRVRLMERIDAKEEKKSIARSIWSWISDSPLRTISIGAGLAGVIIAALLIRPATQEQVAVNSRTDFSPSERTEVRLTPEIAAVPDPNKSQKAYTSHKTNKNLAKNSKKDLNKVLQNAPATELAAAGDVLSGGDSNEPVDLQSLSVPELESVLSAVQSMK